MRSLSFDPGYELRRPGAVRDVALCYALIATGVAIALVANAMDKTGPLPQVPGIVIAPGGEQPFPLPPLDPGFGKPNTTTIMKGSGREISI